MIADPEIIQIARRFLILERYPKTEEGVKALVEALQSAETKGQVEQFVKSWIRNNKKCPMPCDVYKAFDSPGSLPLHRSLPKIPMGVDVPPPAYFCNQCGDTGWVMVQMKQEIPELPGVHYMGVKRCSHPPQHRGVRER